MKLGCKILITLLLTLVIENHLMYAQEKITSSPLLNIDQIKPSFDEQGENKENLTIDKSLKKKKKIKKNLNSSHAILIGLDKITAKSSEITIYLNKAKKFGPLETLIFLRP